MTVIDPTSNLASINDSPGLLGWLTAFLRRILGPSRAESAASPSGFDVSTTHAPADVYVVAPGGYRIRVPQPDDVPYNIGQMLPAVREGMMMVPPLPHAVVSLLKEIQNPSSSAASVATIAANDPSLAATLIRTVNSAAMGVTRKITSVSESVSLLGFSSVKSMVLRLHLDKALRGAKTVADPEVEDLWIHSLLVSYIGEALAKRVPGVDRGFVSTLGLLHDMGKLVLHTRFPEEALKLRQAAQESGRDRDEPLLAREARVLGLDHAGLGANLALQWGLPGDLVKAIRWHHFQDKAFEPTDPQPMHQAMYVVQIADQLAKYLFTHCDEMEIDSLPAGAFEAIGFSSELTDLLGEDVLSAARRAIFFVEDAGVSLGVRPFLRLRTGNVAKAMVQNATDSEPRTAQDDELCERLFVGGEDVAITATASPTTIPPGPHAHLKFLANTETSMIEKLSKATAEYLSHLSLPAEQRCALMLVLRRLLSNFNLLAKPGESLEVATLDEGSQFHLGVRADAMTFQRRLNEELDSTAGRGLLDAELANLLNLGWFEAISTSADGGTLVFTARA